MSTPTLPLPRASVAGVIKRDGVGNAKPAHQQDRLAVYQGDCRDVLPALPAGSVNCCVTSPPYWGLRDYGTGEWIGGLPDCDHIRNHGVQGKTGQRASRTFTAQAVYNDVCGKCGAQRVDRQIGMEPTPDAFVQTMVSVFREVRRVLTDDGTLWLNLGDSYANPDKGGYAKDRVTATDSMQRSNLGANFIGAPNRLWEGLPPKNLVGIPWRVALALQADGWYLRCDIIWNKPAPMPESVTDRPTKAHEYIFLLTKSERYFYDADAIMEPCVSGTSDVKKMLEGQERIGGKHKDLVDPLSKASSTTNIGQKRAVGGKIAVAGDEVRSSATARMGRGAGWREDPEAYRLLRNARSVWTIGTRPYPGAHFATFPPELPARCIKAGCPADGTVLDPFHGSGTTGEVARELGRKYVGIELNPDYIELSKDRTRQELLFLEPAPPADRRCVMRE